jgi:hypothetical protein
MAAMTEPTFEQVQEAAGQPLVRDAWENYTPEMRLQMAAALGLDLTPIGRKRGRPASPVLDVIREAHPHCSPRTHARIKRAMGILFAAGTDAETMARIEQLYVRPSGSFNAAGFEAHAEAVQVFSTEGTIRT